MVEYVCDSCGHEGADRDEFWKVQFENGDGPQAEWRLLCGPCCKALLKMIDGDFAERLEEMGIRKED